MNVSWVFVLALALAGAANAGPVGDSRVPERSDELRDVWSKFVALVPRNELRQILDAYLARDADFNSAVEFFFSDAFRKAFRKIESVDDVAKLFDYLREAGLDVHELVKEIHLVVGLPPPEPRRQARSVEKITGGPIGFLADCKAVLPLEKLKALSEEQARSSPAYARFLDYWNSPRFLELIGALRVNPEFQEQLDFVSDNGVHLWYTTDLVATTFGLEFPNRIVVTSTADLDADLKEFRALVPEDEIMEIYREYMTKDPEAMFAYGYLRTPEYRELLGRINGLEDVVRVYDYLRQEAGLDARALVNLLSPQRHRRDSGSFKITGGPAGYIADIKAVLPVDKIKALHEEKLKTSPAFARFVHHWNTPRFLRLVEALRSNSEFQKSVNVAKKAGVDLVAIADLYFASLGLRLPGNQRVRRSVDDDSLSSIFNEFGALLPTLERGKILEDYLLNDEEFNAAVLYLTSPAFKKIVEKAEKIEDLRNVYEYLENAGLPIHSLVNNIHDVVGLPPYRPEFSSGPVEPRRKSRSVGTTGGASGFIADYKALLPHEKIRALHEEKLRTSPAFARFVGLWNSPRFAELIDALRANPEFQELLKSARENGFDVVAFADLYAAALGLEFPGKRAADKSIAKRSVGDVGFVLLEFLNLVPIDKYNAMMREYLRSDKAVQTALRFFVSDAFKKIIAKVDSIEDVLRLYDYLEEAGLEVYSMLNDLHAMADLPPLKPGRNSRSVKITGGMSGLIADYKAILPIDKIRALHEERLKTSPAFARFVEYLKAPRFQEIIETLRANEELREQLRIAKEGGIDVVAIADLYLTAVGLELPGVEKSVAKRSADDVYSILIEFLSLVPAEKLDELMKEYLENDKELQAAFQFFLSDASKKIIARVNSIKDVIRLYDYLEEAGLDVYKTLNDLHAAADLPLLKPGRSARSIKITGGLAGLMADYKAILPIDKIKALHQERLKTSPAFARFVEYLKAPRFQEIIEALRANQELQEQLRIAKEGGIDIVAIADFYLTAMGFELSVNRVAENSIAKKSVAKRSTDEVGLILLEFLNLVPIEKYNEMMREYLFNDEQFPADFQFFLGDTFKKFLEKVDSMKDVIRLYDYLEEAGLDVYTMLNDLHAMVDLPPLKPGRSARSVKITGGMSGLIADYKAILPIDRIKALHEERLKTSPAFARFVEYLKSPRFLEIIETLRANREFQEQLRIAKEGGVDFMAIADLYLTAVGLELPISRIAKRSVDDLDLILREFLNLVPQNNTLLKDYLENDKELQANIRFLLGDSFKKVFEKIEATRDVIRLYDYLEEAGLKIYALLKDLHFMTGLPPLTPPARNARSVKLTGGISGLIADYKAILPIDRIKALHEERLKTSPAFARLVEYLKSPRFLEIIETLRGNQEFRRQLKIVEENGIDVVAIADFAATVIGLELPGRRVARRSVDDLDLILREFLNLVPQNNTLLKDYLENDKELQANIRFLLGDSFKKVFEKIEAMRDVIRLYDYLEEAGLKIYALLKDLHFMTGLPPLTPPARNARSVKLTGGISGLIADYKAILPIDRIKALHEERLKTSPAFARLVEYLKSPRFLEIIGTLRGNQEFRRQLKIVEENGIDVVAIADFAATVIGLELPGRRVAKRSADDLDKDIEKFRNLVPRKKLHKLVEEYMVHDEEFGEAALFVFSDDFKNAVRRAESLDDLTNFLDYLEAAGLDVYNVVDAVHFLLGLPPLAKKSGRQVRSAKITGGPEGFIADYRALLPVDKIKALHEELLKTSPVFKRFVGHWKAPRFSELIEALRENEEFQKQLKIAKAGGVDVRAIVDLYASMVGLEFPEIERV